MSLAMIHKHYLNGNNNVKELCKNEKNNMRKENLFPFSSTSFVAQECQSYPAGPCVTVQRTWAWHEKREKGQRTSPCIVYSLWSRRQT